MKILGIDTSTDFLSIAVVDESTLLVNFEHLCKRQHLSYLMPSIKEILKKSNLSLRDLDGFAVSIGPGSFTGLRVGVSTVKGLALISQKPVVGIASLDVIAQNVVYFPDIICPIIDAKKNKLYSALYQSKDNRLKKLSKYLLISLAQLMTKIGRRRTLFLGDGIKLYKDDISQLCPQAEFAPTSLWFPRASIVAKMGLCAIAKGRGDNPYELVPMYLYSRECSITGK
jgi:tRNA threonylcarbamoyl adenosine modification protein YeaZ